MFGQVIRALIYLCFLAILFYIVIWVLEAIGIALPVMVIRIIGVIVVLFAILILYNLFSPYWGTVDWWGRRGPPPNP